MNNQPAYCDVEYLQPSTQATVERATRGSGGVVSEVALFPV